MVVHGRLTQDTWKDASGIEQKRFLVTATSIDTIDDAGKILTLDGGASETLIHGVPF